MPQTAIVGLPVQYLTHEGGNPSAGTITGVRPNGRADLAIHAGGATVTANGIPHESDAAPGAPHWRDLPERRREPRLAIVQPQDGA